jgi:tetratricopeptide (TPR) repeat protein/DNA-binding transcriptional ArsR family regulator
MVDSNESGSNLENYLSTLLDAVNIRILRLLMVEPMYTRQIARTLNQHDSRISERLSILRRAGLIQEIGWRRLESGSNVKLYFTDLESLSLTIDSKGVYVKAEQKKNIRDANNTLFILPAYSHDLPSVRKFVGRKNELLFLKKSRSPIVVWGLPGIGKTTAVAKYARELLSSKTPVFWHKILEVDSFAHIINKLSFFLFSLGQNELHDFISGGAKDERAMIDLSAKGLSEVRATVIFDDFHKCRDEKVMQFVKHLAGRRRIRLIIISRYKPLDIISESPASELKLRGLSLSESEEFIRSRKPALNNIESIIPILQKIRGHPLTLEMLCSSLKEGIVESIFLEKLHKRLYKQLIDTLDVSLASTAEAISVFREAITLEAVNFVFPNRSNIKNIPLLERLGLLEWVGEGRFELHDMTRQVVYDNIYKEKKQELHMKAAEYYKSKGDTRSLLEAIYHYSISRDLKGLSEAIEDDQRICDDGYVTPYFNLLNSLVAEYDKEGRFWIESGIAKATQYLHIRIEENITRLLKILNYARTIGSTRLQRRGLTILGYVYRDTGQLDISESYLRQALTLSGERMEKTRNSAVDMLLLDFAELYVIKGRYEDAIHYYEKAIQSLTVSGKEKELATVLNDRGLIQLRRGYLEDAIKDLRSAVIIFERLGIVRREGIAKFNLGIALELLGSKIEALQVLTEAIDRLKHSLENAMLLEAICERIIVSISLNDDKGVQRDVIEAKRLAKTVEKMESLGVFLMTMGVFYLWKGRLSKGRKYLIESERMLETSDLTKLARTLAMRGIVESRSGNEKLGKQYSFKAKEIFSSINSRFASLNQLDMQRLFPIPSLTKYRAQA